MSQEDRSVLGWGALVLATAALFVAVFAVMRDDGTAAAPQVAAPASTPTVVEVRLNEFSFSPATITVPPGPVTIRLVNIGSAAHNFVVPALDARSPDLQPGQSYDLDLGVLAEGTHDFLCDIPGHAGAGMVGVLSVQSGMAAAPSGSGGHAHGHGDDTWQEIDFRM
jgi:manganese oxidase